MHRHSSLFIGYLTVAKVSRRMLFAAYSGLKPKQVTLHPDCSNTVISSRNVNFTHRPANYKTRLCTKWQQHVSHTPMSAGFNIFMPLLLYLSTSKKPRAYALETRSVGD
jgi:hypothetical protein